MTYDRLAMLLRPSTDLRDDLVPFLGEVPGRAGAALSLVAVLGLG
jgi:hypothetical protein